MGILVRIVLNGIGLLVTAYVVPGVVYHGSLVGLLVAGVVIGLINLLVKPVVKLLSLPFIIVTLGLFLLLINGAMLMLAAAVLPNLTINGCLPAILGGLVMAVFNWVIEAFTGDDDDDD